MKVKMRYFITIVGLVFMIVMASAGKLKSQGLPYFEMQLTNGSTFSSKSLPAAKPLLFIYFAPDCEHCQVLMDAIFKRIDDFKSTQIVMVTFKPLSEVSDFEKHYQTGKYGNIKVGMEVPIFFFRKYYQLENTPFTALYGKDRKLVISYKKDAPVEALIKLLKKTS